MIVAVTGVVPVLIALNEAMLPVPLAASPIEVVLLVQLYTVPVTAPLNVTADVEEALHTVWLVTVLTVGVGFTVIVNEVDGPKQGKVLCEKRTPLLVAVHEILFLPGVAVAELPLIFSTHWVCK